MDAFGNAITSWMSSVTRTRLPDFGINSCRAARNETTHQQDEVDGDRFSSLNHRYCLPLSVSLFLYLAIYLSIYLSFAICRSERQPPLSSRRQSTISHLLYRSDHLVNGREIISLLINRAAQTRGKKIDCACSTFQLVSSRVLFQPLSLSLFPSRLMVPAAIIKV